MICHESYGKIKYIAYRMEEKIMTEPVQESRDRLYIRLFLRLALLVVLLLFMVYALPPLLSLLAPFLAAFLVAVILNPPVTWLHDRLKLPRTLVALVLVVLLFAGVAALISWGVYIAVNEAVSLAKNYSGILDSVRGVMAYFYEQIAWILDIFPKFGEGFAEFNIMDSVYTWIQTVSEDFLASPYSSMADITAAVSNAIVGVIIFLIAAFFLTVEYRAIGNLMERYFGDRVYGYMRLLKNSTQSALWRYLKAQLLLALLAFVVMFTALLIYGQIYEQKYVLLIALSLAFIDFLPIVGAVAVLIPWALVEFFGLAGEPNYIKAVFLLILAVGFFVLRKVVEPKILGSQTGLHPLVALASIYVGLQLGGVLGAILGPVIVMVIISIYNTQIFDNTIKDVKCAMRDVTDLLHRGEDDHDGS